MSKPHVIIKDNFSQGFKVIGPFYDFDEAAYSDDAQDDLINYIIELTSPTDKNRNILFLLANMVNIIQDSNLTNKQFDYFCNRMNLNPDDIDEIFMIAKTIIVTKG